MLLLRGPQTPGELRGRTERLHEFSEISDVIGGLQRLMEREPPLVALLPRQPGARESRYAHLLSGPLDSIQIAATSTTSSSQSTELRLTRTNDLRSSSPRSPNFRREVSALREKIDSLLG